LLECDRSVILGVMMSLTSYLEILEELVSSEISDLLLFVCYFASQNKEIKFGNYFLMCGV